MRVQNNPEDIGRCGCGRRIYCDGSHALSEAEWQERCAAEGGAMAPAQAPVLESDGITQSDPAGALKAS